MVHMHFLLNQSINQSSEALALCALMAPVILKMDVNCDGCAAKIRKAIRNMLGVERVWVSRDTGLVVVTGMADALALRRRLRHKIRKSVTILSDGTAEELPPDGGMTHLAPPHTYDVPPPGYPPYYTWAATALPAPYVAAPAPAAYIYGNQWASTTQHQYVPGGTPTRFVDYDDDDDETPNVCCSVQ